MNQLIGYDVEEENINTNDDIRNDDIMCAQKELMQMNNSEVQQNEVTEDDDYDDDFMQSLDDMQSVDDMSLGNESLCDDNPELTIIDNCGNCILKQVNDSYKQHYFDDLYGCIHCSTEGCKNKKLGVEQLIKKHGLVHICEKCTIRDMYHGCQIMMCHECWSDKSESEGRPQRIRRATMV